MYRHKLKGVCANEIVFDIINDRVYNVKYDGGCSGNLQAISRLVEGQEVDYVIKKLRGIECNGKGTSCPDQLAKVLEEIKQESR